MGIFKKRKKENTEPTRNDNSEYERVIENCNKLIKGETIELNATDKFIVDHNKFYIDTLIELLGKDDYCDAIMAFVVLLWHHKDLYEKALNKYGRKDPRESYEEMWGLWKNYQLWGKLFPELWKTIEIDAMLKRYNHNPRYDSFSLADAELLQKMVEIHNFLEANIKNIVSEKEPVPFGEIYQKVMCVLDIDNFNDDYTLGEIDDAFYSRLENIKYMLERNICVV